MALCYLPIICLNASVPRSDSRSGSWAACVASFGFLAIASRSRPRARFIVALLMCASVARSAGAQQASLPEIPTGQQLVDLTAELDSKLLTAYTTCDIDTFVSMAESHRPGQAQEQASPDLRRTGRAARGSPDWREPERHPRSPALVDAIPPLQGQWGRPRRRPDCVLGDRGYDAAAIRRGLRARHIVPWLAMRRTPHGSGLGGGGGS